MFLFKTIILHLQYVVDGNWQHNPSETSEVDHSGNTNNVFTVPSATSESITSAPVPADKLVPEPIDTASPVEKSSGSLPSSSSGRKFSYSLRFKVYKNLRNRKLLQ